MMRTHEGTTWAPRMLWALAMVLAPSQALAQESPSGEPAPATGPEPGPPAGGSYEAGSATAGPTDEPSSHDTGLGPEWFWINLDGGFAYASMDSLNSTNFALQNTTSSGPTFGVGAGVRLMFLSAGLRARDLPLSNFNIVELDGEAAIHIRIGHGDQYFGVRGGYAFSGSLNPSTLGDAATNGGTPSNVNVHGGNGGLMIGFDYYFNHLLSIGLDANPEVLFLQRPPATPPSFDSYLSQQPAAVQMLVNSDPAQKMIYENKYNQTVQNNPLYKESGSSIGFAFVGTLHLGLHF